MEMSSSVDEDNEVLPCEMTNLWLKATTRRQNYWRVLKRNLRRIPQLAEVDEFGNRRISPPTYNETAAVDVGDNGTANWKGKSADAKDVDDWSQDIRFVGETSLQSAIPFLPRSVAVLFLLFNIVIPGSGNDLRLGYSDRHLRY